MSSMLTAGIVQDTFAGEAGEGRRGRQSGEDWRLLQPVRPEILPVSSQLNFYRKSLTRARVLETYVRIYTYENLDLDD